MWDPSSNHPSHGDEVASHEAVGLPFEFWSAEEIQKRLAFDLQSYGPQAGSYTFCWIDEEVEYEKPEPVRNWDCNSCAPDMLEYFPAYWPFIHINQVYPHYHGVSHHILGLETRETPQISSTGAHRWWFFWRSHWTSSDGWRPFSTHRRACQHRTPEPPRFLERHTLNRVSCSVPKQGKIMIPIGYIYIPIYIYFFYLFIYLFVYFIHLFIYSFIYLFIHLFIYLFI